MHAKVGDTIVVEGAHVGDHRRVGVVIAVKHEDGSPPYTVRWNEDQHEVLLFPGPDTHIRPEP